MSVYTYRRRFFELQKKKKKKNSPYSSKFLRRQFETNVFGLMDVTNATLPYLRKTEDSCVVVFGSRSVWRPEILVSGFTSSSNDSGPSRLL